MKQKIDPGILLRRVELNSESTFNTTAIQNIEKIKTESEVLQREFVVNGAGKVYQWTRSEYENVVYWSLSKVIPMYTTKFFVRYKVEQGATYNKKTKTLKLWFGKSFLNQDQLIIKDILQYLSKNGYEFMSQVPLTFVKAASITTYNKVAKGKITNPKDFIKDALKKMFPGINVPVELVWKLNAKSRQMLDFLFGHSTLIIKTCSNPEAFLNHLLNMNNDWSSVSYTSHLDMAQQAFILGKKISYCWSPKRLEEEHFQMSREIAYLKFQREPIIEYNYHNCIPHPFIKLITNSRELFVEGTGMQHCVYSNYADRVKLKQYFVFRYDDGQVRATVGVCEDYNNQWIVQQVRTRKNGIVSDEIEDLVKEYIAHEDMQKFFKKEMLSLKQEYVQQQSVVEF